MREVGRMDAEDDKQVEERRASLEAILASNSPRKLIVAGPGTGKSFTFQELLKLKPGPNLALTFINVLAADLASSLSGLADAGTFHGFCKSLLHQHLAPGLTTKFNYYPELIALQVEDLRIAHGLSVSREAVEHCFHSMDSKEGIVTAAILSGNRYDAVGHLDSVHRVLRQMQAGSLTVPVYTQIVVDEFQDFSPLEVAFIQELAKTSSMLLVGDDDQALYTFKGASPTFIRDLFKDDSWEKFELPYCSRCTSALVNSVHDVIASAQKVNLLSGRIDKRYECYLPDKRAESEAYPAITHVRCSVDQKTARYPAKFIAKAVMTISQDDIDASFDKGEPTALVIGPPYLLPPVEEALRLAGANVTYAHSLPFRPTSIQGVRFLLEDPDSPLGWRVLLHVERPDGWEEAVRGLLLSGEPLHEHIDDAFRNRWLETCATVEAVRRAERSLADVGEALEEAFGVPLAILATEFGFTEPQAEVAPDPSKPSVRITTLTGAKGLQARHVYVVGLNEGQFPKANSSVTEDEVCQLLVALTRAKSHCTLISAKRYGRKWQNDSIFTAWLQKRISTVVVDKSFFS